MFLNLLLSPLLISEESRSKLVTSIPKLKNYFSNFCPFWRAKIINMDYYLKKKIHSLKFYSRFYFNFAFIQYFNEFLFHRKVKWLHGIIFFVSFNLLQFGLVYCATMHIAHSKNVIVWLLFHLDRCAIVIEFTSL